MTLPTNIDATYPDDAAKPGTKAHQQNHDVIHAFVNSKGVANGVAPLGADGRVPAANLPTTQTVVDATTSVKGIVQLAGDLAGTAAAPTVPSLTTKVNTSLLAVANGVATLGSDGKVPSAQLPAGVDTNAVLKTTGGGQGTVNILGNQATTAAINLANGNTHTVTLTGNVTAAFSGFPATGKDASWTVVVKQDATGGRTITWPASVAWDASVTPTSSNAANSIDVYEFLTVDGGTTVYGWQVGKGFLFAVPATGWNATMAGLSPYSWLKVDEASGTSAADASGNIRPGTYAGTGVTYSATALKVGGTAVTLDGTAGLITHDTALPITSFASDCTIAFWMKHADPGTATPRTAYSTRHGGADTNPLLQIGSDTATSTRLRIFFRNDTGTVLIGATPSTSTYYDNTTHFVVVVHDATANTIAVYRDGVLDGTLSYTESGTFGTTGKLIDRATWGATRGTTTSQYFNGTLDDPAVWTRKLTGSEISSLYAARTTA